MVIKKNESLLDRFARIILSLLIMFVAYVMLEGFWQLVAYAFSAMLAITAATGFCLIYTFLGIDTKKI
ncbi:MAG: DUF2892 domain-containing protein [Candidatus Falkowbacteria bacterium]